MYDILINMHIKICFLRLVDYLFEGKERGVLEKEGLIWFNELLILLVIIRVINSFHIHFPIVDFIG